MDFKVKTGTGADAFHIETTNGYVIFPFQSETYILIIEVIFF